MEEREDKYLGWRVVVCCMWCMWCVVVYCCCYCMAGCGVVWCGVVWCVVVSVIKGAELRTKFRLGVLFGPARSS